jgi:hypothetical protein
MTAPRGGLTTDLTEPAFPRCQPLHRDPTDDSRGLQRVRAIRVEAHPARGVGLRFPVQHAAREQRRARDAAPQAGQDRRDSHDCQ